MFLHHVEFKVAPETLESWQRYIPGYLGAMARLPGSVSFRVLADRAKPNRFFSLRTWLSQAHAEQAKAMPESVLAGQPGRDGSFYEGMPVSHEEFQVLDMVWGLEGSAPFAIPGHAAQHIVTGPGPGKFEAWRPYARNFASVMARQPGLVSHETLRSLADPDKIVVLRTFRGMEEAQAGPEYDPPAEVRLAQVAAHLGVYEGAKPAVRTECRLFDVVWGLEGPLAYDEMMAGLQPA